MEQLAPEDSLEEAFRRVIDTGNQLANEDQEGDTWGIADGMLAGAIQFWLYSRRPCGDPRCADCDPINTAQARLHELQKLVTQLAEESEYFHAPTDINVGRA